MRKKIFMYIIAGLLVMAFTISSSAGLYEMNDEDNDGLLVQTTVPPKTLANSGVGSIIPLMTHDLDLGVCGTGAVQCSLSGHTYAPASSANHNPIRIGIMVTINGVGQPGLHASDFTFTNTFVPAGGGAAVICGTTDCGTSSFQDGGNGLYTIFVHRGPAGNWKAGHYFGSLSVKNTLTSLVSWEIP